MLQHLLLMMVAPPLLWLGAPLFPLLLGLPRPIRTYWVAPFFRWHLLRRAFERADAPRTGVAALRRQPPGSGTSRRSTNPPCVRPSWHYLQHLCFLGTALLFWYPVVRPYPSRPRWSLWLLFPYLILADVQNTLLSALLTFSDQPLYRYYVESATSGGPIRARRSGGGRAS